MRVFVLPHQAIKEFQKHKKRMVNKKHAGTASRAVDKKCTGSLVVRLPPNAKNLVAVSFCLSKRLLPFLNICRLGPFGWVLFLDACLALRLLV